MIVKEADPIRTNSQRARTGSKAEQDMAFYLRRAFADREDVFVFHDLRLEHAGEVAQIDHLILHRHGIFIVESKSVTGEIHITPAGQFIRHFRRGKQVGMPSPVAQARRQGDLLRRLLQTNRTSLRDRKVLGVVQGGFKSCPIEIRVAISDRGIIRGEQHALEVRKADLIPEEVEKRIKEHRWGSRLLNLEMNKDGMYCFTVSELNRVRAFLLEQHRPLVGADAAEASADEEAATTAATAPSPRSPTRQKRSARATAAPTPEPAVLNQGAAALPQYLCSKCQSLNLRILYGKYGYYFKCDDCAGNTWIDTRIDGTDRKGRIRKSGREFFLADSVTGEASLVFVNPE